jgi:type II secretory pathway pseudopilin PulG
MSSALRLGRRLAARIARDERGIMMMELVIAMTFLALAVGAMLTVFASSMISLRNAGVEGTALTLAESQMEAYKTLTFAQIGLDTSTVPSGSDPYNTANSTDSTMPTSSGLTGGVAVAAGACTAPTRPVVGCAVQTLNGPDGRQYRVDTYVKTSGTLKTVTVVARIYENGAVGRIKARASTAFDPATTTHNF